MASPPVLLNPGNTVPARVSQTILRPWQPAETDTPATNVYDGFTNIPFDGVNAIYGAGGPYPHARFYDDYPNAGFFTFPLQLQATAIDQQNAILNLHQLRRTLASYIGYPAYGRGFLPQTTFWISGVTDVAFSQYSYDEVESDLHDNLLSGEVNPTQDQEFRLITIDQNGAPYPLSGSHILSTRAEINIINTPGFSGQPSVPENNTGLLINAGTNDLGSFTFEVLNRSITTQQRVSGVVIPAKDVVTGILKGTGTQLQDVQQGDVLGTMRLTIGNYRYQIDQIDMIDGTSWVVSATVRY